MTEKEEIIRIESRVWCLQHHQVTAFNTNNPDIVGYHCRECNHKWFAYQH